ncbi:MAG: ATP-binding cassette domain-containing protein [Oscillospiraceae bacterium]|jgi:ABC-type lipoprotein export system ATPase subunit|nr:ATP-binding cassette domain-containing protein [Oscillospiraceae bacterium]
MIDFGNLIAAQPLSALLADYPVVRDFFLNLNLPPLNEAKSLADALLEADDDWLLEFGLTREEIPSQLAAFLTTMTAAESGRAVTSLTIIGGRDKSGGAENIELHIEPGTVVSIVGPTGSGKSRLLGDIECLAQGDTPTARRILIDGAEVTEDDRFNLEGKIVAQLSQNMNFVMDLTVAEFLEMHARSRAVGVSGDADALIKTCFECANSLAGEKFTPETKVTQLSGGQSRALMIADCAYISQSAIVLIDEIENAGVDRREAIALLAQSEKIVLISTHDPLLALGADKRIVIKNGGISAIIDTSAEEKASLVELEKIDRLLYNTRKTLRAGGQINDLGTL